MRRPLVAPRRQAEVVGRPNGMLRKVWALPWIQPVRSWRLPEIPQVVPKWKYLRYASRRIARFARSAALTGAWLGVFAVGFVASLPLPTDNSSGLRVAPMGTLLTLIGSQLRGGSTGGGGGGGGGGGSYSSPDALSTVTYNPEPHPAYITNAPDLPTSWVTSAKGSRTYVSDVTITNQGSATANMDAVNTAIGTAAAISGHKRIKLTNGLTYQGTCRLLAQTGPNDRIDIEAVTAPCAEGVRPTLTQMASQPNFHVVGNNNNTVNCQRGANGYRITGVKHTCQTTTGLIYFMVHIHAVEGGMNDEDAQALEAHVPRDIVIDRCSIEGVANAGDLGRTRCGIDLNGIRVALVDSIVTGQYSEGTDTHGVLIHNTPGPVKIVNNFIDSGSEPIIVGGAPSSLGYTAGQPKDLEIRRNHLSHPEAWCPTNGGSSTIYGLKGLFELKNSKRTLFEGNVLERCPDGAQIGMAIVLKSAGDGFGASTGMGTSHATLRYNIVRNVRHALNVDAFGDPIETGVVKTHHLAIYHNLFHDIGTVTANGNPSGNADNASGKQLMFNGGTDYLNIRFNTIVANLLGQAVTGVFAYVDTGLESAWLEISDNVILDPSSSIGVFYSGGYYGDNAMNIYAGSSANWEFNRNLFVGVDVDYLGNIPSGTGNVTPAAGGLSPTLSTLLGQIDFVNAAAANYRLDTGSPGKGIGYGGADAGVNMDTAELATGGVVV